jgi:hypothetical protein
MRHEGLLKGILSFLAARPRSRGIRFVHHFKAHSQDVAAALALGLQRGLIKRQVLPHREGTRHVYSLASGERRSRVITQTGHPSTTPRRRRRLEGFLLLALRGRGEEVPTDRLALATDAREEQVELVIALLKQGHALTACCAAAQVRPAAVRLIAGCIGWSFAWRKPRSEPGGMETATASIASPGALG